jgi:hypothetical protein
MLDDLLKQLQSGIQDSQSRRSLYDAAISSQITSAVGAAPARGRGTRGGFSVPGLSGPLGRSRSGGKVGGIKIPRKGTGFASREQLQTAAEIARTGKRLGASRRDIVTALATGLVESGLREINYGHLDSVGPFQQRTAWGPKRARINAATSARLFFKGGRAGQEGLFDIKNRDRLPIGVNAQDVQVSAYPGRYATQVDEARQIMKFLTSRRRRR